MNGDDTQHLFTRRRALIVGSASVAGVAFMGFGSVASARSLKPPRLQTTGFKRARFTPHVGSTVELRSVGARALRGKLAAVEDLPGASVRKQAGSQDAYALRFRAPLSLQIGQGTLGVRHPLFVASSCS